MIQALIVVVMAVSVAVADALCKKAANDAPSFGQGLIHWLMLPILALYFVQIALFIHMFRAKWELGRLGIMQMAAYSICVVLIGSLFFGDKIQPVHGLGVVLALAGVTLMNL
ncbi:MAG: hypothetical protein HY980_03380 [Candidatus Magasanikbacteria bacterium]|nr:hypothetical protein [Candidatus Magasanikbacteria bacterium]